MKLVIVGWLTLTAAADLALGQYSERHGAGNTNLSTSDTRRGPLARLVRNPDTSGGLPPFALSDQSGTIQRYVEPVDGIDLEMFVDQVVVVRHDTGRTLLASQLELVPQPLLPLRGEIAPGSAAAELNRLLLPPAASHNPLRPVQFADDDDGTVELLLDGQLASQPDPAGGTQNAEPSGDATTPEVELLPSGDIMAGPELEPMNTLDGGRPMDGVLEHSDLVSPLADGGEFLEACPECGAYHAAPECPPGFEEQFPAGWEEPAAPAARLFADVEFNFFRTHLVENAVGKLSEKYQFSPRVSVGFRDTGKVDGRARYWHYDRETRRLAGGSFNVEFDVLDLEGTHLFLGRKSELQLSSGLRLAAIDLTEGGTTAGANLLGVTFAADGRTCLCSFQDGLFTWTYGGRLAILGGDWGGQADNAFVTSLTQDDNLIVHELRAGIDYAVCHRDFDFHGRLGFELQNWHSDALASNSIGIIGPSFLIGAEF